MVISERKPMEEILGFLKGCEKVILVGCGQCASACKVGGAPEIEEMTALLEAEGKTVLGSVLPDSTCNLLLNKKELKSVKEELKQADAVLSLACGDGTQTIMKNTKKQNIPVYPANNTMFIGEVERVGKFEEACKACGKCVAACPRKLIEIVPYDMKHLVKCNSKDKGKDVMKACKVGCIGCKMCEKACQFYAVKVLDNVAHIDPEKCTGCGACAAKCPKKVIL